MKRTEPTRARLVTALVVPLFLGACAGSGTGRSSPSPTGQSVAEIESLYEARTESARSRFTDADVGFVQRMIGHHAQALVMADLAQSRADDPTIRTLASRITNGQRDEIATMERWLRDREQPVPRWEVDGLHVMLADSDEPLRMPGMLTPSEMHDLEGASGREFDRLFLERMVQHHEGAVTMVEELFTVDGAAQDEAVFKLASDIQVDQRTEIARMRRMLSELPQPHE